MNEIIEAGRQDIVMQQSFSSELFSRWIAFIDAKEKTVQTYNRAIKQFLYYMAEQGIKQPTRADILAYREYLSREHKPTTVQSYLMAVKQFFKWTAQERLYPNIADNVKRAKLDTGFKKDYLTSKQVKTITIVLFFIFIFIKTPHNFQLHKFSLFIKTVTALPLNRSNTHPAHSL